MRTWCYMIVSYGTRSSYFSSLLLPQVFHKRVKLQTSQVLYSHLGDTLPGVPHQACHMELCISLQAPIPAYTLVNSTLSW
jgi:hypothetical protein